jgi:hypothetical protein
VAVPPRTGTTRVRVRRTRARDARAHARMHACMHSYSKYVAPLPLSADTSIAEERHRTMKISVVLSSVGAANRFSHRFSDSPICLPARATE